MRIVSLEPFVTDIIATCQGSASLVGITHECVLPPGGLQVVVTESPSVAPKYFNPEEAGLAAGLSRYNLNVNALKKLSPDKIITQVVAREGEVFSRWAEQYLQKTLGRGVVVQDVSCSSLDRMYAVVEEVAGVVGHAREGRMMAGRAKAQLMEWADSFYSRCKGKRVVVLSGVGPARVASSWIPSLVRMFSATPFRRDSEHKDKDLQWDEVRAFNPDVIVIAPIGSSLSESVQLLPQLQLFPGWEELPAVKRGEVVFCDGVNMYRAGPRFVEGAAVLLSAIAGLESGFITKRDEFYKIRYIELYRHKFLSR